VGGAAAWTAASRSATPIADVQRLWVASRIGRELRPDSPFLARLDASRARPRASACVDRGGVRQIIIPACLLERRVVHVPGLGHLAALLAHGIRAVAERLALRRTA